MYCKVLLACAIFGYALAAEEVPIISQESVIEPDGAYHYSYETGDGVKANAVGELKTIDKDVVEISHGAYSWTEDGKTYSVNYVADENGFQPTGDHLPVAPEIPAMIQKALAYLATAPPPKE